VWLRVRRSCWQRIDRSIAGGEQRRSVGRIGGGDGRAVAAGGGGGAGEAAAGGGADQAPDPARGALGLLLLHAPEGLPQLRPRHPAARPPTPQCRQYRRPLPSSRSIVRPTRCSNPEPLGSEACRVGFVYCFPPLSRGPALRCIGVGFRVVSDGRCRDRRCASSTSCSELSTPLVSLLNPLLISRHRYLYSLQATVS
jgi:hypothetical protein